MKKIVSAFLVGALTMVSFQAFASGVFLGKKVDGETSLKINGKVVGQAIIVDGKSFAPVREVTNGVGGSVVFNKSGGAVEMTLSDSAPVVDATEPSSESPDLDAIAAEEQKQLDKQTEIRNLERSIEYQMSKINDTKSNLETLKKQAEELRVKAEQDKTEVGLARTQYGIIKNVVQETTDRLSTQEKELADLQAQLAELQK